MGINLPSHNSIKSPYDMPYVHMRIFGIKYVRNDGFNVFRFVIVLISTPLFHKKMNSTRPFASLCNKEWQFIYVEKYWLAQYIHLADKVKSKRNCFNKFNLISMAVYFTTNIFLLSLNNILCITLYTILIHKIHRMQKQSKIVFINQSPTNLVNNCKVLHKFCPEQI